MGWGPPSFPSTSHVAPLSEEGQSTQLSTFEAERESKAEISLEGMWMQTRKRIHVHTMDPSFLLLFLLTGLGGSCPHPATTVSSIREPQPQRDNPGFRSAGLSSHPGSASAAVWTWTWQGTSLVVTFPWWKVAMIISTLQNHSEDEMHRRVYMSGAASGN